MAWVKIVPGYVHRSGQHFYLHPMEVCRRALGALLANAPSSWWEGMVLKEHLRCTPRTSVSVGYQHLLCTHRAETVTGTQSQAGHGLALQPENSPQPARWLAAGLHLSTQDMWSSNNDPHTKHTLFPSPP